MSTLVKPAETFNKQCAICNTNYGDEEKWLAHFFNASHKKAAFAQFGKLSRPSEFWLCPSRAASVVHVFSVSCTRHRILQEFSALGLEVTNCISLSERPTVSVIQFRDPVQVTTLFDNSGGLFSYNDFKLRIDGKAVDVFRAGKFSRRGSWKEWFSRHFDSDPLKSDEKGGKRAAQSAVPKVDENEFETKNKKSAEPFNKHCNICNTNYGNKEKWFAHFFDNMHKNAAWAQFKKSRPPSEYWLAPCRMHSVVHIRNISKVSELEVLRHFTALGLDVINWISSSVEPTVSVVQFQDSGQVRELFGMSGASSASFLKLLIDDDEDKTVDVFRAENPRRSYRTWNAWFSWHFNSPVEVETSDKNEFNGEMATASGGGLKHCAVCDKSFEEMKNWKTHFFRKEHKDATKGQYKDFSEPSEFWIHPSRLHSVICVKSQSASLKTIFRLLLSLGMDITNFVPLSTKTRSVAVIQLSNPGEVRKLFDCNEASASAYLMLPVDEKSVDIFRAKNSNDDCTKWNKWFCKHFNLDRGDKQAEEKLVKTDDSFRKHCLICFRSYEKEEKWLKHFFKRGHKEAAWDQLSELSQPSRFWLRPCRIYSVVHLSSGVTLSFTVLQRLSSFGLDIVNCVSLSKNPAVAVIQFEKAAQVKQLFNEHGAKSSPFLELPIVDDDEKLVKVDIGRAQFSKNDSWEEWFQNRFDKEVIIVDECKKMHKRARVVTLDDDGDDMEPTIKKAKALQENNSLNENSSRGSAAARVCSLDDQFEEIRSEIEIPLVNEQDPAWAILRLLGPLPQLKFPNAQFHQFRHCYHRLRSAGTNKLHLFVQDDEFSTVANPKPNKLIKRVLNEIETELVNNSITASRSPEDKLTLDCVYTLLSSGPFEFTITSNPVYLPEVQACRMLQYLCEFDERVTPLLTLIMYWSRSNGIRLGSQTESRLNFAPEPSALEWMLMFFLIEKKIIPSPRQVQEQPHEPIFYKECDLGFANTRRYVVERRGSRPHVDTTSNRFHFDVLRLATNFLHFVATCGKNSFVLNTKDGNRIPREYFDTVPVQVIAATTTLSVEEVKQVKEMLADMPPDQTFIIHPLRALHSFSLNNSTLLNNHDAIMGIVNRINEFLLNMKENPELTTDPNTFQNLFICSGSK